MSSGGILFQWLLFKKPSGTEGMCGRHRGTNSFILGVYYRLGEGPAVSNEGVDIDLDERTAAVWKEAEEVCKAVSSRIIIAQLKLIGVGQRRVGGSRETKSTYISIPSVYAPTANAPPATKQKFMEDLQDALNEIPPSDVMLLLGDLNARVGSANGSNVW